MNWSLKTVLRRISELSPSCKQAARLQSLALDRTLTPLEWLGLRIHTLFCRWCRAYARQIRFLHSAAGKPALDRDEPSSGPVLSTEARERIKRNLQSRPK